MSRLLSQAAARSCGRKTAFPTREAAEAELRRHGYRLHVYRCPYCGQFHLTRQPQRRGH